MKPQTKASRKYNQKAYDRIEITVPKGHKARIQAHAENRGLSVNQLIKGLLEREIGGEDKHGNTRQ